MRDTSSHAIDQANVSIDRWWVGGPLSNGAHFQAAEQFALLAENIGDVLAGASAEANQHQFHGAIARFFVPVNDDSVAGSGDSVEAVVVD